MGFYRPGRGRDSTRIQLLAKRKVLKAKLQSLRGKRRWANVKTSEDEESVQDSDGEMEVVKDEPKVETILMEKKQPIVKPKFIIRPLPAISPPDCFPCTDERDHPLSRSVWVKVFQFLSQGDLCRCLRVCKTWNRWCYDSTLWRGVSISKTPLTKYVLAGIVRRQPTSLDLSGSKIDKQQLAWLCVRLPQLRELYLARTPPQTLSAICSADCPQLRLLDLQWVSLKDSHLAALLSPITDHRPGLVVDRTKLHKIRDLRLAGSDITDASVGLLVEQTPGLIKLDLSYCGNITDEGIGTLLAVGSTLTATLTDLNVSGCIKVTDASLIDLSRCTKLRRLIAYSCPRLTKVAWQEWAANSRVQLIIQ